MRALALASWILLGSQTASAQADPDGEPSWRWRRFDAAEHVASTTLALSAITLQFSVPWSPRPNLVGGLPAEEWLFERLHPTDESARAAWLAASNVPFVASMAWTVLDPILAGALYDWDVAGQMALINLESHAALATALWATQHLVRRRRPIDRACDGLPGPGRVDRCDDPQSVRSFIGGHTALVATATALTCMHHAQMPLLGGGVRDALPCGAWIGGTALTFVGRTVSGSHYLGDNLLGLGLGALAGGVLPWALHYAHATAP
jgi:hypothetical protein